MLPQFLLSETIVREAGQSPDLNIADQAGSTLILTLGITRIIEQTAADHTYPYNRVSLWGMVRSHFRFLYQLGRRPADPATPGTESKPA